MTIRRVSEAFQNAITTYGRQTNVVVTIGETALTGSSIVSARHAFDGGLLRSVMRECEVELDGLKILNDGDALTATDYNGDVTLRLSVEEDGPEVSIVKGTEIDSVSVGVKTTGEEEYAMLDLGRYVVNEIELDKSQNSIVLKCYDEMLYSMIPYDLNIAYPITVGEYLAAICTRFGWTLSTTSFVNSDVEIEEEKYDAGYTFRDVLDQIAQVAAGTIALFDSSLCVLYPTESGVTYSADNMVFSDGIIIGDIYGPVTSVVLARTPQEDNIYRIAEDVSFEEAVEFKIENNQIMDSHREDFIDGIFEQLNGLSFYLYEFHSFGYLYVDLMDFFTLCDQKGVAYKCLMMSDEFTVGQGIDEESSCVRPPETVTDYVAASKTDRVINQTILRVDKQSQEITSLVSKTTQLAGDTENIRSTLTEVKQTADNINITVTDIKQNGVDKVKTSMGYTFDNDGLRVAKDGATIENRIDNTGMYVKDGYDTVLSANNDGVNAINIKVNQYLIIGKHSRFEDFTNADGEERTGCFWLG